MKQVQHTEKQLISCTHNKKYHLDKKKSVSNQETINQC